MPNRDTIVVGASAGGIEALQELVAGLPAALRAAVMVVLHMAPSGGQSLARILQRSAQLPVELAENGQQIQPGHIYIAPGDRHLLLGRDHLHVRKGPRENGHRPAVDPLFRSAAAFNGPRVIGVVLSGTLSDGTSGLYAVKQRGGLAVVQTPEDALYSGMPLSALQHVHVDHAVTAAEMGPLLAQLSEDEVDDPQEPPDERLVKEVELMHSDDRVFEFDGHPGRPSAWPCPDCNGVLWEIHDGPVVRYRCRVGHAWSAEALLQEQARSVEGALWMALRALEDRAALGKRLGDQAEATGRTISARRYRDDLGAMNKSINILRRLLTSDAAGFELDDDSDAGQAG